MRAFALWLLAAPFAAQATRDVVVDVAGVIDTLTFADLAALPQDTVRARMHGGPEQEFAGPRLAAVLARAGARLDSLRGSALAQYVVVDARDGYRVVLAVAELAAGFTTRRVILAQTMDGRQIDEGAVASHHRRGAAGGAVGAASVGDPPARGAAVRAIR
jgi:hypothetical protein